MRCAKHLTVETYLRCSKCEIPICPDCMIETPVGMRCRSCACPNAPRPYAGLRPHLPATLLAAVTLGWVSLWLFWIGGL